MVVYNVVDMKRRGSPTKIRGSSDSVTETGARQEKSSSTVTIRRMEGNGQEKSSGRAGVEVKNRNTETSEEDARRDFSPAGEPPRVHLAAKAAAAEKPFCLLLPPAAADRFPLGSNPVKKGIYPKGFPAP